MKTSNTVKISFLYISSLIGAGFATGRELYHYFFRFGYIGGTIGVISAAVLLGAACRKTLLISRLWHIDSYDKLLCLLFGRVAGSIFNIISLMFFTVLFAAMSAAFGELFHTITGVDVFFGSLFFCLLCMLFSGSGKSGIAAVSALLCPVMTLGCCILGAAFAGKGGGKSGFDIGVFPSAVIYVSYNLLTVTAVLCDRETSKKQALQISVTVSVIFAVTALLIGCAAAKGSSALPIYDIISGRTAKVIYIIILCTALLTTALGNTYCLLPYMKSGTVCTVGFFLSLMGFGDIVDKGYFIFGITGCGLLAALLFYPVKKTKILDKPIIM